MSNVEYRILNVIPNMHTSIIIEELKISYLLNK